MTKNLHAGPDTCFCLSCTEARRSTISRWLSVIDLRFFPKY
jgi:hypothetical protein